MKGNLIDLKNLSSYSRISKQEYQSVNAKQMYISDLLNQKTETTQTEKVEAVDGVNMYDSNIKAYEHILDDNSIVVETITPEPIRSNSDLEVGYDYGLFKVKKAGDSALMGCTVVCQIIERRLSNVTGAEGRLVIRPLYVIANDGKKVLLDSTDIVRSGKNRQSVKWWLFNLLPIAGSGAIIQPNEEIIFKLK